METGFGIIPCLKDGRRYCVPIPQGLSSSRYFLVTSYPNKYKSIFHYYLEEHYIPDRCFPYISEKDPDGVEKIKQTLFLMPDKVKAGLFGTLAGRFIRSLLPPTK